MKTFYFLPVILFVAVGCSIFEGYYDDNFNQPQPPSLAFTKVYPGVAEFRVYQEILSTIELPADSFINSVSITKFPSAQKSAMWFFTKVYGKPGNAVDSLLLFQISESTQDTEVIPLGYSVRTILDGANVDLKILDAGAGITGQPQCRGYYSGTFLLTLASVPVGLGRVEGFVAYDGELSLEFKSPRDFNRLVGYGIDAASTDFMFSGGFMTAKNDTIASLVDTLHVRDSFLTAKFKMASSDYDTLTLNLSRIQ
ncbi:hypothetical protein KK062_09415 [Fulvivirgaceae bacterium PWU5]|uniref:Lipoprotein n=1 Tax=Dawidia cretensis TaxID=2782350 RepID=A0AAP2DYK7_9BACT|nr:hypothetical protein [Dawidia cretensis]MBT1708442.1 hypothetical protein [Dawidia cretensis]